jgi:hypothetical protein
MPDQARQPQGCGSPQADRSPAPPPTDSSMAARCHGSRRGAGGATGGAVSRMKRSSAATIAAASWGEALGAISFSWGRRLTTATL